MDLEAIGSSMSELQKARVLACSGPSGFVSYGTGPTLILNRVPVRPGLPGCIDHFVVDMPGTYGVNGPRPYSGLLFRSSPTATHVVMFTISGLNPNPKP